jgi:hypothetical protein
LLHYGNAGGILSKKSIDFTIERVLLLKLKSIADVIENPNLKILSLILGLLGYSTFTCHALLKIAHLDLEKLNH